jgi:hypothetical protein
MISAAALVTYREAQRRAARALLDYCDRRDLESARALADAAHNLEAAALVLRAPSLQERAALLARRAAAR